MIRVIFIIFFFYPLQIIAQQTIKGTAQGTAYFCNQDLRGFADEIIFNDRSRTLILAGGINLQNSFMFIQANSLTLLETSTGYTIISGSQENIPLKIDVATQALKLNDCIDGMQKIDVENLDYSTSSNLLELMITEDTSQIILRGNPKISRPTADVEINAQSITIDFDLQQTSKIKFSGGFRLTQDLSSITAQNALIDYPNQQLVALGDVQFTISEYGLFQAERLSVRIDEQVELIINQIRTRMQIR